MNILTLEKELKIRNASATWKEIKETEEPLEIDCSSLEKFDGAGFQLLLYLTKQEYRLTGLSDDIIDSIDSKGFEMKGETK